MKTIEIISIPVSNQEKSKEYYLKLGFQVIVEAHMCNGHTWVQLAIPNQVTSISLVSWWPYKEVEMSPGSLKGLMLETEDIEKEVKELRAKCVQVGTIGRNGYELGKIDDTPWGKFTHLIDPDGNVISLHQK